LGKRRRGLVFGFWVFVLLVAVFSVVFNVPLVRASGTIYIRADGSIDPPTAPISTADNITYTFTDNIYDSIVVERGNIAIDGNRYTVQGSGSGNGFTLSGIKNVTIKNTNIKGFGDGLYLGHSEKNTISGNNITDNWGGINFEYSCNNNTISENNITNNYVGVRLYDSSSNNRLLANNVTNNQYGVQVWYSSLNNTISDNNIASNRDHGVLIASSSNNTVSGNSVSNNYYGILLYESPPNVLRNNRMNGNQYNLKIWYSELSHLVQDIDSSNNVDGKPVYYWVTRRDMEVPSDAGYVVLVNSYNITVKELELKNNSPGILLANTTDSQVTNNNVSSNEYGGVWLYMSSFNIISGNKITNNYLGIMLDSSLNNTVSRNNLTNNNEGTHLRLSTNNSLYGNNITANGYHGIGLDFSSNNTISENNITNNGYGIGLYDSSDNKIFHNNFIDNTEQADSYDSTNVWDDGYPSGGNYWSDYTGIDNKSGPGQDQPGSDGLGDVPYVLSGSDKDGYPLMNPWGSPQPPIAIFTYSPEQPVVGEVVSFDASISDDRDGSIVSYKWDFGDGNITTVNDPIITHVYTAVGTYAANLTVTDNDGLYRNIMKFVTVKLYRSSLTLNIYPTTVPVGSNVTINGTLTPTRIDVNMTISYRLSAGTWATLATVQTDSNSNYTYLWKTTYVSTYEIKATWAGDEETWQAESDIKTVNVQGYTIYIMADGSVDPPTAPIQQDVDMYTFTDDIYAPIAVQRSNIIIDGAGYTLQGSWIGEGFYLSGINNVTIQNTIIKNFNTGIYLYWSSYNNISNNRITNNIQGVYAFNSSNYNTISRNYIANNNGTGISVKGYTSGPPNYNVWYSSNNVVSQNNVTDNGYTGVYLVLANSNTVSKNNITNNGGDGVFINGYWSGWPDYVQLYSYYNIVSENNITNNTEGIGLLQANSNTISKNNVANHTYGIILARASSNTVTENNVVNNGLGVDVATYCGNNIISGNNISNNTGTGILLHEAASSNTIAVNNITNNGGNGIQLSWSPSNNRIYHNNFINNGKQALVDPQAYSNTWDDGYPSGGNHWSDYTGVDANGDGIGDTPYILSANNRDRYPLMSPWPSGPSVHDLEVSLKAPTTRLPPGTSTLLEATVRNNGIVEEEDVALLLSIDGNIVNSTTISQLETGSSYTINYLWTPTAEGLANITAYATPVPGEIIVTNNRKTAFVTVSINPPVQNIDTGLYYETIQEAIDAPETLDGHTIKAKSGIYYEHVTISKSLKIFGEDRTYTIVDGSKTGTFVVQITVNNVVLSGFTIQNSNIAPTPAIRIYSSDNVISNNTIINNGWGIYSFSVSNNTIRNNIITNNVYGIYLEWVTTHTIKNNTISDHQQAGIYLRESSNNVFSDNIIKNNKDAIVLGGSNNKIYHNNFIDNTSPGFGGTAEWDNGYPSGGNYWSDYAGADLYSGPYQNETGSDGIGDTSYTYWSDRYPLMRLFNTYNAGTWDGKTYNVDIISNSTISNFQINATVETISFNVTGAEGTTGFTRITIPNVIVQNLWAGNYTVRVNDVPWPFTNQTDAENTYIYLTYNHSELTITIVPEFPLATITLLFIALSTLVLVFSKKKLPRKSNSS